MQCHVQLFVFHGPPLPPDSIELAVMSEKCDPAARHGRETKVQITHSSFFARSQNDLLVQLTTKPHDDYGP